MEISRKCPDCNKFNTVVVNERDYNVWCLGDTNVQDAFPSLSADEREILLTGICGSCWDRLFGKGE